MALPETWDTWKPLNPRNPPRLMLEVRYAPEQLELIFHRADGGGTLGSTVMPVEKARELAHDILAKYGSGVSGAVATLPEDLLGARFAGLEFDDAPR